MNHGTHKITKHTVVGERVSVWHAKENDEGYSIFLCSGGWLVGSYDSVESALMGAELDLKLNSEFYTLQKEINHFDKGNRLITANDLLPLLTGTSK